MNSLYNNLLVGKVCIELEEIDSTNSYAKHLVSKSKPLEGTAIITPNQTKGRGQFGKIWVSEPHKNLTFSIILYPNFLIATEAYYLNMAISLGLIDFLRELGIQAEIKWPNDIYHRDQKLAGLLIENGLTGQSISYSIVGIGLNVGQTLFPSELANPTSLELITGNKYNLSSLLHQLFSCLEGPYLQLKRGQKSKIQSEYSRLLYKLNLLTTYETANGPLQGTARGVDEFGRLIIESDEKIFHFSTNEIALRMATSPASFEETKSHPGSKQNPS